MSRRLLAKLTGLLLLVLSAHASIGDNSQAYHRCVTQCHANDCAANASSKHFSLPYRITFWSCLDDCKYQCQQVLTDLTLQGQEMDGLPNNQVVMFHGKWPFKRFLGMQEPFSVLFSLFNFLAHARYFSAFFDHKSALVQECPRPLLRGYQAYLLAALNLWIWSMIFHTRDKAWTEKMDYFSAASTVLLSLYIAIIRLFHLYIDSRSGTVMTRRLVQGVLITIFVAHVSYLTFWKFDYGYNMKFNLAVAALHNIAWYSWTAYHYLCTSARSRTKHFLQPTLILTALSGLMALELFDFAPIGRMIDAHALWHLSTVLVIGWWWRFYIRDARHVMTQMGSSTSMRQNASISRSRTD